MTFVRTSLLNAVATVVKILSGVLVNKTLAIYVGPAGFALVGHIQNAVAVAAGLAGGIFTNGVIKCTAEHRASEDRQHGVWRTAAAFSLLGAAVCALILVLGGASLAEWLLHEPDLSNIFVWLALGLPAIALNNLFLAVLNGRNEVPALVFANILSSLLSLASTALLTMYFGLYGAVASFILNPVLAMVASAAIVRRFHWARVRHFVGRWDRGAVSALSGFGVMGLTSALTLPLGFILIRNEIVLVLGVKNAGYWQAAWGISGVFVMLITNTLAVYYLPRLAAIRTGTELRAEIRALYFRILPLVLVGATMLFLLRDIIISLLFTAEFKPMRDLFAWQLTGDVLKVASWVLGYVLVGRAMVRTFVVSEVAFSTTFVLLNWLLVRAYGLPGASMAYAASYALYWAAMAIVVKKVYASMAGRPEI